MVRLELFPIKKLIIAYIITLSIFVLSFIISFELISKEIIKIQHNYIEEVVKELKVLSSSPFSIFVNNIQYGLIMTLPVIGLIVYTFILTATGYIASAIIHYNLYMHSLVGDPIHTPVILLLAVTTMVFLPHGILEFIAYSLAIVNSFDISKYIINTVRKIIRKDGVDDKVFTKVIVNWLLRCLIIASILLLAAFVEVIEIELLSG